MKKVIIKWKMKIEMKKLKIFLNKNQTSRFVNFKFFF